MKLYSYHYRAAVNDLNMIRALNMSVSRMFPYLALPAKHIKDKIRRAERMCERKARAEGASR